MTQRISDNYAINDQTNIVIDAPMSGHGSDGHGDTQVHHTDDEQCFPMGSSVVYYSNIALSAYETVDFGLVADMIQIQMGPALGGAAMAASHTLGGLTMACSMIGTVPSLMMLLICMSLIGIEINVISPLMQAVRMNSRNFYTRLEKEKVSTRFKDIQASDEMDYNEKGVYKTILPVTLLSLYIFKNAYLNHDEEETGVSYTDLFKQCFNVAHMIGIPQLNGGGTHIRSMMQAICSMTLGIYNCSRGQGGWGSQLVYYQHYASLRNANVHNAFFKYRFPWKNNLRTSGNNRNAFVSYVARMLFCVEYSDFELYSNLAAGQRKAAFGFGNFNKEDDDDTKIEFDRYLFDNGTKSNGLDESILNQIGLDSIQLMLWNLSEEEPNEDYSDKFIELLKFSDDYAEGYKEIMDMFKGRRCVFGEDILDFDTVEAFQTQREVYNQNFKINPKVISDIKYSQTKVLNSRENTSKAKDQKKIYISAIGNNITLGFLHVGWYKYNWNPSTFDVYVKVRGQYQIIQNVDAIIEVINNNTLKSIDSSMVNDLEILERVFDGQSDEGTDEQQLLDEEHVAPLQPLINFVADIGNIIEAMTIRSVYKTDIWDHDMY